MPDPRKPSRPSLPASPSARPDPRPARLDRVRTGIPRKRAPQDEPGDHPPVVLRRRSGPARIAEVPSGRYRWIVSHEPSFHVVGVSHHTAGVEVREHFALTPAEAEAWLAAERLAGRSAVLLSTCNRCEVYWMATTISAHGSRTSPGREGSRAARGDPAGRLGRGSAPLHRGRGSRFADLGGVRDPGPGAPRLPGGAGGGDHRPSARGRLRGALATGRRVRRETMLGRHPASVSSAAVDVAASVTGGLDGRRALVLGAGSVAEGILQALQPHPVAGVAVVNRHRTRAETLAASWGAVSAPWGDLEALLAAADVVFVSTSSTRPLVGADVLAEAVAAGPDRRLTVLDLSVPRNVEPSARAVPGVRLVRPGRPAAAPLPGQRIRRARHRRCPAAPPTRDRALASGAGRARGRPSPGRAAPGGRPAGRRGVGPGASRAGRAVRAGAPSGARHGGTTGAAGALSGEPGAAGRERQPHSDAETVKA